MKEIKTFFSFLKIGLSLLSYCLPDTIIRAILRFSEFFGIILLS